MNIRQLISLAEDRRLEFEGELPTNSDIAKTIVAFANDAGGEIYIGINDHPREIIGVPEDDLLRIEEQISNLIYDRCYPTILPEISFLTAENKHIIRVQVYRGSMPPYYLKNEGKLKSTSYPEIELRWREVGLSFQVQFIKRNYRENTDANSGDVGISVGDVGNNTGDSEILLIGLIRKNSEITAKELAGMLNLSQRQCERIIADLKRRGILSRRGTNRTGYWIINES